MNLGLNFLSSWKTLKKVTKINSKAQKAYEFISIVELLEEKIQELKYLKLLRENVNNNKFKGLQYDKERNEIVLTSGEGMFIIKLSPTEFSNLLLNKINDLEGKINYCEGKINAYSPQQSTKEYKIIQEYMEKQS